MARTTAGPRTTAGSRFNTSNITSCLKFSGNAQNLTFSGTTFNWTDTITMGGQFMFLSNTNYGNFPTFWSIGGNAGVFLIMQPGGNAGFHLNISGEKGATGSKVMAFKQWYWVFGTYDGATIKYYLFDAYANLIETASSSQSGAFASGLGTAVAYDSNRGYFMNMMASRVLLGHFALTQAEIVAFIKKSALTTAQSSLANYWKINEGSGTAVAPTLGAVTGLVTGATWDTGIIETNGSRTTAS